MITNFIYQIIYFYINYWDKKLNTRKLELKNNTKVIGSVIACIANRVAHLQPVYGTLLYRRILIENYYTTLTYNAN